MSSIMQNSIIYFINLKGTRLEVTKMSLLSVFFHLPYVSVLICLKNGKFATFIRYLKFSTQTSIYFECSGSVFSINNDALPVTIRLTYNQRIYLYSKI